ncbi:TetR family transcriptional regulator [Agromyces luteolus]|uniref:TetR family transcriptional regulator n=1 Tax=Agromyces luteolus TaxID=88373 RepID=A0A7C9HGB4_9MICO|nr:TetR/AcrR family transcriptional regulator [Agromyces luteolus]MUN06181.1 TetR family transcriptional regulator [Agromyces luteolus]GLK28776.1 TetR family transcriptional regulator [Agromyces luteolus]
MDARVPRRGRPSGRTGTALLAVAREVFLERGFAGTSMDEVAARAKISKSSLYREHPSKDALYAAVVTDWAAAGRGAMRPAIDRLVASRDIREGLIEWGGSLRRSILHPSVVAMRRLVISEAPTQPEVAATYLDESWRANIATLADALERIARDGRLDVPDPAAAAEQLTWLVVGAPLNAVLLESDPDADDVVAAIDVFLARYGVSATAPSAPPTAQRPDRASLTADQ